MKLLDNNIKTCEWTDLVGRTLRIGRVTSQNIEQIYGTDVKTNELFVLQEQKLTEKSHE